MGNFSAREIEFNSTVEDYYTSIQALVVWEDAEYLFSQEWGHLVDKVRLQNMSRWHILWPMEIAAFMHAISKTVWYYKYLNSSTWNIPGVFPNEFIWARLEQLWINPSDANSQVYEYFRQTIILPEHKGIIKKINENPEVVFWLQKYYTNYSRQISSGSITWSERIEMKVALGILMVHLMTFWIRPYMLEEDPQKRQSMIDGWEDWVFHLAQLFDDFLRNSEYFWFQNLLQDCQQFAMNLQAKKEAKLTAIAMAKTIMQQLSNPTPPPASASSHPQDPLSP